MTTAVARMIQWLWRSDGRLIGTILLFGLAIRLLFSPQTQVSPDSIYYFQLAERITQGHLTLDSALDYFRWLQPGYAAAMAGIWWLFTDPKIAGVVISLLAGLGIILLVFDLGKRLFGRETGVIASILVTLHVESIGYSTFVLTEALYTVLLVLTFWLWLWIRSRGKHWGFYLLLGVCIGLSYYVRLVGLLSFGVVVLWLAIDLLRAKPRIWRHTVLGITALTIGVGITIGPYVYALNQAYGKFVLTGQQRAIEIQIDKISPAGFNLRSERTKINTQLNATRTDYLLNDVRKSSKLTLERLWDHFLFFFPLNLRSFITLYWFVIVLLVWLIAWRHRHRVTLLPIWFLLSWCAIQLAPYAVFPSPQRYYYPMSPWLLLLAAASLALLLKLNRHVVARITIGGMGAVVLISELVFFPGYLLYIEPLALWRPSATQIAGQKLETVIGPDQKIIGSNIPLVYYARGQYFPMPSNPVSDIIDFARYRGIRYMAVFRGRDYVILPNLQPLIDTPEKFPVSLVYQHDELVVFEILRVQSNPGQAP